MRVTPEQSKQIQEMVFANGGCWVNDHTDIRKRLNCGKTIDFLFLELIDEELKLAAHSKECIDESQFSDFEGEEIDADLFIRTNGTCEE